MAYDFKKIEETARKVWRKHKKAFEAAIQEDSKKELFSFLEGPPTANASPGLHHLEVRTFKDVVCKYKYMQGFSVPRKGGWDTHGLPVEVQVEKKLGLRSKKEVLEYGMEKFIKECRESVFSNINDWEKSTEELHYQIDLKNPYITLDNNYIESVWWSLKELHRKGFLYEGFKVVPFCTRCGTPLSSHEVSQGYKEVKDTSVYVAFKVKGNRTEKGNKYILAWTTTPWTLPGNIALAVGAKIDYVKVKLADGDFLILAESKLDLVKGKYEIIEKMKGKELEGLEYEPLFDVGELQNEKSHKIVLADFVTTEDGTGVVHTAGMYGEDDYTLCKELGLPLVHVVGQDGKFNSLVPEFEGMFVKAAEKGIIENLKKRHLLFKSQDYSHQYPFCWRCNSPLIYYAIDSWFIAVTKVRDEMVALNKDINWSPPHIRDGRFGKWLENIRDWSLSRLKFWGTPLPVWKCECGEEKIIGSVEELREFSTTKFTKYDLHRPWIDKIKLKCKCGKKMSRVSDLIDVWYDSGAASFAQFHYPFENKKEFERRFPYDFISEAVDQTRGWFYTLHAISVMLFGKAAYQNVICAGHVLDEKGEKMSKSKGNIIKPDEMIEEVGIDAVRLQMCTTDPGNSRRFSQGLVRESVLPFLTVLENCKTFYDQSSGSSRNELAIEDKWILSRLNSLTEAVIKDLDEFLLDKALEKIMAFTINDFSRTYIKITRDREDKKEVLGKCLKTIALLIAPYAPYISESIFSDFEASSVHLWPFPKANTKKIDGSLEQKFGSLLENLEIGFRERDSIQVGLKWPLSRATIHSASNLTGELEEIIKKQLNVKEVVFVPGENIGVEFDTVVTPELEAEGYSREIVRKIQALRKTAELVKTDRIVLRISSEFDDFLQAHQSSISHLVGADSLSFGKNEEKFDYFVEGKIKSKKFVVSFNLSKRRR